MAVNSRRFGLCCCRESQFRGSCSGRKNIYMCLSLCLSSVSNLPFASSDGAPPPQPPSLQTDLTSPKLCGDETVSQSSHFNSALLGGNIVFSGHCSSSPGRHSRSAELPSDRRPLLRPHLENKSINPPKKMPSGSHEEPRHKA